MTRIMGGVLLGALLGVGPAGAQTDYSVALRVGGAAGSGAPQGSSLRVTGTGPRTAGQLVLGVDGSGNVLSGGLGVADIPAPFTRRDVAEVITQPWTFSAGITGPLSVTTSVASPLGLFSTAVRTPLVTTASGPLTLGSTTGLVRTSPTTTAYGVDAPYTTDVGEFLRPVRSIYASELSVGTLTAREKIVTTGGDVTVGQSTTLVAPLASGDGCIFVEHNAARVNDWLHLQARMQLEYVRVGSGPLDCSIAGQCAVTFDAYAYCGLTRGGVGTGPHAWLAGDTAFNTGNTGDGWLNLYAERSSLTQGYAGQVMRDRPVLYWRLNETSGTTAIARVGPTGTYAVGDNPGNSGASFTSDGGTGYTRSASTSGYGLTSTGINSVLPGTGSMSFEVAYRKGSTVPPSTVQPFVFTGAHADAVGGVMFSTGSSVGQGLRLTLGNATTRQICLDTAAIVTVADVYYHLVAVVDRAAGRCRLYVNGALHSDAAITLGGSYASTANVLNGAFALDATYDEIAVYPHVLTADDVARHYAARVSALSATTMGPAMSAWLRTGTGAAQQAVRLTVGNLDGTYGYTGTHWGLAAGDPAATWIAADATLGFRVMAGATPRAHWAPDGSILIGSTGATIPNLRLTDTGVTLQRGSIPWVVLDAGGLTLGAIVSGVSPNSVITASELALRRGTTLGLQLTAAGLTLHDAQGTMLTQVSAGAVTVGQTTGTNANAFVTGGRVELRRGTTVRLLLDATTVQLNDPGGVRRVQVDAANGVTVGRQTTTGDAFVSVRAGDIRLCGFLVACTLTLDGATGNITSTGNLALLGTATIASGVTVGTAGFLRSGQTAYAVGTGYWLEFNLGTPRLSIGSPSKYLRWTGAELQVQTDELQISDNGLLSNQVRIDHSGVHIGNAFGAFSIAGRSISWDGSGGYFEFNGGLASAGGISAGGGITANGDIGSNVGSASFFMRGQTGQTATVTVRNAAGTGTCTLIYTGGIKTGGTC